MTLITAVVLQEPPDFNNGIAERGMMFPVGGTHLVLDVRAEQRQPMALFLEIVLLALPRTVESSFHDERCDRVEFSAIQVSAMSSADIDHGPGDASKIYAVHQFVADDTGTIPDRRLSVPTRR